MPLFARTFHLPNITSDAVLVAAAFAFAKPKYAAPLGSMGHERTLHVHCYAAAITCEHIELVDPHRLIRAVESQARVAQGGQRKTRLKQSFYPGFSCTAL